MEKLIEIIKQVLDTNKGSTTAEINENTHLRRDLGFDSLELAELTVRIEDEFGVDVFADGMVDTVGDILKKVK